MKKEPMKVTEIAAKPKEQKILRVAAYARVSTDKDAAFHSLEAQKDYYEKYVSRHTDWKLVAVYSDNGISGTTINRPAFQEMLEDCRNGKIDLVITKSVSRFARNVVILLETMRELKALGIDIYFEKDNMHSISPDGELLLTLIAMYAEEEARSASENQKWRIQKKFEKGEPWVGHMLGYRLVEGKMVIIPEEAEAVRQIFSNYLSGMGCPAIAKKLRMETPFSRSDTQIARILRNEKYIGDMLLQKTYRIDFRHKTHKDNHGEVRQYYVENSHEPIIDRETFEKVQEEIARRKTLHESKHVKAIGEDSKPFVGLLICGICGGHYVRKRQSSSKRIFWRCNGYIEYGKSYCPSQSVPDKILAEKTLDVLGASEITDDLLKNTIKRIEVISGRILRYVLKDGSVKEISWEAPSRSESWTPEMRQKARERAIERHRKEVE